MTNNNMSESFEQPKNPIYPTESDRLELSRVVDTNATGANLHKLINNIGEINIIFERAKRKGWNDELLKEFNESKTRLYKTLSGAS
jgi:hypothetical protein